MNGLQLTGLSRSFGNRAVLHDVDLTVQRGEIVGFVGGNGAGKTTTMRLILGLLSPDDGHITWDGHPISDADRRGIGYMPEERGLYPQMPVRAQLVHFALLEGHSLSDSRRVADELILTLGLQGRERTLIQDLSLGNQQRVQLAVALVGNPALLVLDEPFSGLDPSAVAIMGSLLQQQAARGVGILFSSHQLDLVEKLCHRVCILDQGRVKASGSLTELQRQAESRWIFAFSTAADAFAAQAALITGLQIQVHPADRRRVTITLDHPDADLPRDLLAAALRHGGVRGIEPVHRSLDELLHQEFIWAEQGTAPATPMTLETTGA